MDFEVENFFFDNPSVGSSSGLKLKGEQDMGRDFLGEGLGFGGDRGEKEGVAEELAGEELASSSPLGIRMPGRVLCLELLSFFFCFRLMFQSQH